MTRIRVLVVDDSLTVRKRLIEVLASDPDLEVVGEGGDGAQAIALCQALRPDVITLDMMLPVVTGLAATEHIMAHCPTPILIVSASTNRGELFRTYDALAAGAVDVLEKPAPNDPMGDWESRFLSTVKLVSRIKVITHVRGKVAQRLRDAALSSVTTPAHAASRADRPRCAAVAIGVSTGGPLAMQRILVIHIGEPFGAALAEWLGTQSSLRVAYAQDGEPLPPFGEGRVIMARPELHLALQGGRLRNIVGPERHSCRPSVDVLFESVAAELGSRAAACLLTGMGKDGATGLLEVRRAGGVTLAQDEATSIVFGMPREAIRIGAAERVLPLDRFANALTELAIEARPGARA